MRGKGSKLGEPCPTVRLSQDRLPIEPLTQQQFSGLLHLGLLHSGLLRLGKVRGAIKTPCLTLCLHYDKNHDKLVDFKEQEKY